MVLAWFPITTSWNTACYIRGLIHGNGRGVPNGQKVVNDRCHAAPVKEIPLPLVWRPQYPFKNHQD